MEIPEHFHFSHLRQVEFSDTDLAGIMHFSNFLRFVESAEHAFFRSLGSSVQTSDGEGHRGWPRLEISCNYYKPARFEQALKTCLRIEEVRNSGVRYGFWIFAEGAADSAPLAAGTFTIIHVALDPKTGTMQKARIPDALRQRLEHITTST